MDAYSPENSSAAQQHETGEVLPSQELLNEQLKEPQRSARYFQQTIAKLFPAGGRDKQKERAEDQLKRTISNELKSYEHAWLRPNIKKIHRRLEATVLSSPETSPETSPLSFHIINQFVMPQWHRVLVSSKSPKMDAVDLEMTQIQLAIEGALILSARNGFDNEELSNNELRDIDAMIDLTQLSIDSELYGYPGLIALPHPSLGEKNGVADFLIFEPVDDDTFNMTEVRRADVIDETLAPGSSAVSILKNLRINSISRRPEFQEKSSFHKLIRARESTKNFLRENPEVDIGPSKKKIAQWLIEHHQD